MAGALRVLVQARNSTISSLTVGLGSSSRLPAISSCHFAWAFSGSGSSFLGMPSIFTYQHFRAFHQNGLFVATLHVHDPPIRRTAVIGFTGLVQRVKNH